MDFWLSCRRFLFSMKERSGLRDWMKNKKIRYERREDIQAKKKNYLPPKLIYRTYLYSTTPNSITSSCNSIGARGVTGTSRFKATVSCAWNNCFIRLKQLFHTLETTVSCAWNNCFIRLKHLRCRILQRKSPVNKRRVFSENAMYRTLLATCGPALYAPSLRTFFSSKQKKHFFHFALHSPFTIFVHR